MKKGAVLSECRRYRYRLWRCWGDGNHRVAFVGINPSTADEVDDDATIRKCVGFAKRWGFGALDMVNLFAWRDRNQLGLLSAPDPIGPENNAALRHVFGIVDRVVYAWGPGKSPAVGRLVRQRVESSAWVALELYEMRGEVGRPSDTKDGSPGHPLMLPYVTPFLVNGAIGSVESPQ